MKKALIVSYHFPPTISGTPILLGNLLKYFPKESYVALTGNTNNSLADIHIKLDCKQFICDIPKFLRNKYLGTTFRVLFDFLLIPFIVFKGCQIVKQHDVDNIYAVFPTDSFVISGLFIHKITGKPFFTHLFDIYEGGRPHWLQKIMAKVFERKILKSALKTFMNEPLRNHYLEKYQILSEVIPHTVDSLSYDNCYSYASDEGDKSFATIVFTGAIYSAQLDAIMNLVKALNLITEKDVRLVLCTPASPENLAKLGISGKNITCRFAKRDEVICIQKSADILFLPLAFNSPRPLVIKTASPSKMPEYLVSGKPILVHAPNDCYLTHYAREAGFALIVDQLDPHKLKDAILKLLEDEELCETLVKNAQRAAKKHDARKVSNDLQRFLIND